MTEMQNPKNASALPDAFERETIVAVATPPGRGGIGILRLSGPASATIAVALARIPESLESAMSLLPGRARFCHLIDPATREKLDEAVVTYFKAPHSYTGEDVVELSAHGSPVLLQHLLRVAQASGARLAHPGEFTERAFLSGRLDLTQAEAVRDLVDAQTLLQAQVAAQQLGGSLSRSISPIKQQLIHLIGALEAGVDFAEDDTPVLSEAAIATALVAVLEPLTLLEVSFTRGRLVAEGVSLAIVGRPNVGKSSLFNALLGVDRAIVTAEAGTTRDTVQEQFSLHGIPLRLIDTAGMREAVSEAERIGIEKSREALADADVILLVVESTKELLEEELDLLQAAAGRILVVAANKADLFDSVTLGASSRETAGDTPPEHTAGLIHTVRRYAPAAPVLLTSAKTGAGLDTLRDTLGQLLLGGVTLSVDSAMLTNERQHTSVQAAVVALQQALTASEAALPHELILLDLYAALRELDVLTGRTTPDDILHHVFATFCIGK